MLTRVPAGTPAVEDAAFRLLLEQLPLIVWTTDRRLRITAVYGAALELFDVKPDEIIGMKLFEYFQTDDPDFTPVATHRKALKGQSITYDRELFDRTFHFHVEPLRDADGVIVGTIGAALDISDRKRAEDRLRESLGMLRETDEKRSRLLSLLVDAQESERRRIAADIHDDPLQVMNAVTLYLEVLRRRVSEGEQVDAVERVERTVREAAVRLRKLLFELQPPALEDSGLAAALEEYVEQMAAETGTRYRLKVRLPEEPLPHARAILYRSAQEALSNVRKHAHASRVEISVRRHRDGILLSVKDDGVGFDPIEHRPEPGHVGLAAMRERVELAGGWCRVQAAPGRGTAVECWIPAGTLAATSDAPVTAPS